MMTDEEYIQEVRADFKYQLYTIFPDLDWKITYDGYDAEAICVQREVNFKVNYYDDIDYDYNTCHWEVSSYNTRTTLGKKAGTHSDNLGDVLPKWEKAKEIGQLPYVDFLKIVRSLYSGKWDTSDWNSGCLNADLKLPSGEFINVEYRRYIYTNLWLVERGKSTICALPNDVEEETRVIKRNTGNNVNELWRVVVGEV